MRISLFGKKLGMSQVKVGRSALPVTLVQIPEYDIFGIKTSEKNGYNAVIVSAGNPVKDKSIAKPLLSQFHKMELQPREELFEIRLNDSQSLKSFEMVDDNIFDLLENTFVDITGVTMGKGFAGPMKRWNFAGLEASHGVSVSHRSHGSTGQNQDPGRVFKGKKMAGHMGHTRRTVQNLQVVSSDKELRIVAIHGAIPGHKNSSVFINDAVKMGRSHSFTRVNNINLVF